MPNPPPRIAMLVDVRRISARPCARRMPHRRVLEALEDVARRQPQQTALTYIDDPRLAAHV